MSIEPVKIPPMECPAVLLPTPANLKNMVKQIAAMPAKILAMLEVEAATAAGMSEEVKAEIAALDREALGEEAYKEKVEELAGMTLGDAKIAAFDKMSEAMLGGLEKLEIFGFSVMDIIGGAIDDTVETLELKSKRICEEIGRFKDNWQLYLLRKWMELVTAFFDAIGLSALTRYIGMDFWTFLGILGFPTSIDLSF